MKVRAYAFQPGEPPAEIQLWKAGDNPTDYGVHKWTARSVKEAFEQGYLLRGNPLQIDIEHNCSAEERALAKTDDPPATGGYARLEVRNGAPWLLFDWSAVAVEQIKTRQRLALSPEYTVDTETGEIVGIKRVSLVSDPGTHHVTMLARAKRVRAGASTMIDPVILAALKAALTAEDPKVAIEALLSQLESGDGSAAPEVTADAPPGDEEKPMAAGADDGEGEKPVAAAADDEKPATPYAATAKPVAAKAVNAAAASGPTVADAFSAIDAIKRDNLLREEGDRLHESVRAWAKTQSFAVVEGLVKASPARTTAPTQRVAATRGAGQGVKSASGLQGDDLVALERAMGLIDVRASAPKVDEQGRLCIGAIPPAEWRKIKAAAAADQKGGG